MTAEIRSRLAELRAEFVALAEQRRKAMRANYWKSILG